ncbi:MAG TPA: undecaprenyl-diphosphate phosphatase [Bryobacteraceae bacterium]|jgi:undecaprenyl-diphosphatase|nr:undecaprenyl-diphosphate phosphatase [Bryobacteraceae bacterium]
MPILKIVILAIIQGFAELLPVSSSAHVVVAEKLMGLDPSSPQMTLLLVMLHTGTMFAVIAFFWNTWKQAYFSSQEAFRRFAIVVLWATVLTGVVGEAMKKLLEITFFHGAKGAEIEELFGHLEIIAPALAAVGVVILIAGLLEKRQKFGAKAGADADGRPDRLTLFQAGLMGIVQGLALPFRGFSRSGSTISTGMLIGVRKDTAERFSFAMAVVLTPAVVGLELLRLEKAAHVTSAAGVHLGASLLSSLLGMVFSFVAGLLALKWLSSWLAAGRWYLFGIYCLAASAIVYYLHTRGF